jgi:hypothetical protein
MTALEAHLAYCDAEDAFENAEAFERAILDAAMCTADDMPSGVRDQLNELVAWAAADTQKKRTELQNS